MNDAVSSICVGHVQLRASTSEEAGQQRDSQQSGVDTAGSCVYLGTRRDLPGDVGTQFGGTYNSMNG